MLKLMFNLVIHIKSTSLYTKHLINVDFSTANFLHRSNKSGNYLDQRQRQETYTLHSYDFIQNY